jgi:ureidoacrylate peracid hydrolase
MPDTASPRLALAARPEAFALDPSRTAVVVNDMQNAFCSPGGYLEKIGFDIAPAQAVIAATARVFTAARRLGIPIFHCQNGFNADQSDIPSSSPWWHKSPAMRHWREHPELAEPVLTEGTWDFAIVDALAPLPGEVVIRKSRPSCFTGTTLDVHLRARDIHTLVVVGIASNVGVEWTLREAVSRELFGIMIRDATMPAGPPEVQRTVEHNVEHFIGWTATSAAFEAMCESS